MTKHKFEFWNDKRNSDGKKGQCIKCINEKRAKRVEEIKIYNKEYRRRPSVMHKNRQRSIDNWHKRNKKNK